MKINCLVCPALLIVVLISGIAHAQIKSASEINRFVAERINIAEDKTIFTIFAFLNAAGYDDENDARGFHPVRAKTREYLDKKLSAEYKNKLREFYKTHRVEPLNHTYAVVAKLTDGAPDFAFTKDWNEIAAVEPYAKLKDLPAILREFYRAADIEKIYAEARGDYLDYIANYRKTVSGEVLKVLNYCRVKSVKELAGGGETKFATVVPNLLESYSRATSFELNSGFYSIDGPQRKTGYNPHEFIHSITNPLSYDPRYLKLQQKAEILFQAAKKKNTDLNELKTVSQFFDECLVRAVALKYLDTGDAKRSEFLRETMMDEYKSGYILERFFYEELTKYEKSEKSLRQYYPQMLKRLNAPNELARWRRKVE